MRRIPILLATCGLLLFAPTTAQSQTDINELLSRLNENHMGSISEVFTASEISVLREHFQLTDTGSNPENNLISRIGRSTQAVVPVTVCEIDPTDLSSILELVPSPLTEFEGAGFSVPTEARSYIVDNTNRVYIRDMSNGLYTDTGVNINTIPGEALTGIEVLSNGNIYGIGTNGMNSSHLYHINPATWQATTIGGNNGLKVPISLARNGADQLVTLDIDNDAIYGVDAISGVINLIGNAGFDANFGQGMAYDEVADEILLTAFNNTTFKSELRRLDYSTGLTTNLGAITPSATYQFGWVDWFDKDLLENQDNLKTGFQFYPSPANDILNVRAQLTIDHVSIVDITGKQVFSEAINELSSELNIANLPTGLYLLNVQIEGSSASYKFMKR